MFAPRLPQRLPPQGHLSAPDSIPPSSPTHHDESTRQPAATCASLGRLSEAPPPRASFRATAVLCSRNSSKCTICMALPGLANAQCTRFQLAFTASGGSVNGGVSELGRFHRAAVLGTRVPLHLVRFASSRNVLAFVSASSRNRVLSLVRVWKPLGSFKLSKHFTSAHTNEPFPHRRPRRWRRPSQSSGTQFPEVQYFNIIPILREQLTHIQYQYLESCKSIFLPTLRDTLEMIRQSSSY